MDGAAAGGNVAVAPVEMVDEADQGEISINVGIASPTRKFLFDIIVTQLLSRGNRQAFGGVAR